MVLSFRPLDGESFSKHNVPTLYKSSPDMCFRPLDGESFSKLVIPSFRLMLHLMHRFRPLDGESFSKRYCIREFITSNPIDVSVP